MTVNETANLLSLLVLAYPKGGLCPTRETVMLWHSLLSDMPAELAVAATKRLIATSPFPPTIADVRRNAVEAIDAASGLPSANEAWGLLQRAIHSCGYYRPADAEQELPPEIWAIAANMGWSSLCMADESNISTLRAQFERAWAAANGRRRERMTVPPDILATIQRLADKMALPEAKEVRHDAAGAIAGPRTAAQP